MKKLTEKDLKEKHSERYQELESQIKEKEQILEGYKKEHGKLEVFFNKVIDNISPVVTLPQVYFNPMSGTKNLSPTTPVMQIGDAHMGEVQDSGEIEGFNEFNSTICERRQVNYTVDFIKWVNVHRHGYNINECVVLVTGDLISGDIQMMNITNEFPITVQVCRASEVLCKQIALLAPHFKKVTVHFIVEDNHARLTQKPQMKEAGVNSMNYLVGMMAKAYLERHTNVEFNIYPMFEKVVHVENTQYLICHGHGVQGWGGIPYYGIERKVGKESQARLQIIMREIERAKDVGFHKYIFGHWHTPFDMPLYACCGSVSGTGAYDHKAGRYARPSQASWMVGKHGEFNRINFDLQ
jgi:hypothetical protein